MHDPIEGLPIPGEPWARFLIPEAWKTAPPFASDASDLVLTVLVGDASSPAGVVLTDKTLYYGTGDFGGAGVRVCGDDWLDDAEERGRICIENTLSPFFTNFVHAEANTCALSNEQAQATLCDASGRRFAIFAREFDLDGWMDRKQGRPARAVAVPTADSGTEKAAAASEKKPAAKKPAKPSKKKAAAKKKAAKKSATKKTSRKKK